MSTLRCLVLLAFVCVTHSTFAVTIGQLDDFQDGTTQDWTVAVGPGGGNPAFPPANADGGPAGAGDMFLQLTSTGGNGPGSKMVVINQSQWAGDYLGAGVTAISMDVNNMSGLPLDLRMRFEHFSAPGPPTGDFISANSITIAPQSGWQNIVFPISQADLLDINMGAGDNFVTTMSDVGVVRLFHATNPELPPPAIDAMLGVDNVLAVPEPMVVSSWVLLACLGCVRRLR